MKLTLGRIAELVSGSIAGSTPADPVATGYSIDSRTIRPGELFFAVKGEKMDGHDFVSQALEKGAVAAVVARQTPAAPQPNLAKLIVVEDTLEALQLLAGRMRRLWARPLI